MLAAVRNDRSLAALAVLVGVALLVIAAV